MNSTSNEQGGAGRAGRVAPRPAVTVLQCRLCQREAELCDSHVLPEFFYARLYDQKHRFIVISTDPKKPEMFLQKGLRERLLCRECELRLSVYENYARGVIFGGIRMQSKQERRRLLLKDVDYKKFKLFLLSLLWRMGVAKGNFFKAVDLGPYEEKIRRMILSADPGDETEIPCAVTGVLLKGQSGNWFVPPDRVRAFDQRCYRVVICGMLFMFFVSNRKPPTEAMQYFIKADTTVTIPVRNIEEIPFLHGVCIELGAAMEARPEELRKW